MLQLLRYLTNLVVWRIKLIIFGATVIFSFFQILLFIILYLGVYLNW